jgi:phosphohistidine phosphatase
VKTLYLLRHAKSSWKDPVGDLDRPLAPRGRRAAPAMATFMAGVGLVPDRVLCSPAARTRQTWDLMAPVLGPDRPVEYRDEIYHGGPTDLLALIRQADGASGSLMVVGHNPSMEALAARLADPRSSTGLDRLREKYPTAALAVLECPVDAWADVDDRSAALTRFVRPKDLPDAENRGL